MTSDAEIGRLVLIVEKFGAVPGKLAIQKTVYFFEEFGGDLDYEFKWFPLGPYSPELASDISYLVREGSLRTGESGSVDILVGDHSLREYYAKIAKIGEQDRTALEKCFKFLKDKSSRKLELLASLRFIRNNFAHPQDRDTCLRILQEYKAERFGREEAQNAWNELKRESLV